jgi:membrane protein implicated in regulation of membrane protease activity
VEGLSFGSFLLGKLMIMVEAQILTMATTLVATLFALLVTVLGWIGNKIYTKLDEVNETMRQIEKDLGIRLHDIDRRLTKIETVSSIPSTHKNIVFKHAKI